LRPGSIVLFDEYWGTAGEKHDGIKTMGLHYICGAFLSNPIGVMKSAIARLRFGDCNPQAGFIMGAADVRP